MIATSKRVLLTILAGILPAPACGPFFPDTVLNLPQAALRVRTTCLLDEMVAIDRTHGRRLSLRPAGLAMIEHSRSGNTHDWSIPYPEWLRQQKLRALAPVIAAGMPAELAETTGFGEGATQAEAVELAIALLENQVAAERVAEIITAFTTWRATLPEVEIDGPWDLAVPPPSVVAAPPEFPEVPAGITAYWMAARAWRGGDLPAARAAWQAILDLPQADRQHRAVWAAWMLAKTSPDAATAVPFYQKTLALADDGHRDALGLAAYAMGWLAIAETDPVARLKWYFDAACAGNEDMLISLRWQVPAVVADPEAMARAAADPLVREVLTALLFRDGPRAPGHRENPGSEAWLAMLQNHPAKSPSPAAAKAAWFCYSQARFDDARHWLAQAPPGAGEVLWLKAKLALRDGRLNEAARLFTMAAPLYQFRADEKPGAPTLVDVPSTAYGRHRDYQRGQFHSDRAIVHIGRGEFLRAMDFLAKASYHSDAAYLAERVLTTDELVGWVKRNRPAPAADPGVPAFRMNADGIPRRPDAGWGGDPYRYLLARRLAREYRFREAAEFMPPALGAWFGHYVRLHRAARNETWPDETQAVILWNLAVMRRHLGMEFFGYEGAPDNTGMDGNYPALDFLSRRANATGWRFSWDDAGRKIQGPTDPADFAVPPVSREEIQRLAPHIAADEPRFHYRHDAADIAWRAAALLPDNDPRTFFILHTAGCWLAIRHPLEADRFYQAIIRRCPDHPLWRALDERRWFLPLPVPNPMPRLPEELQPSMVAKR